jgi:hypothetical protein
MQYVGDEAFTTLTMKTADFWDMAPSGFINIYYKNTRRHIPEDGILHD